MLPDDVNAVLASTQEQVERLNEHAQKFAFDVVFVYLRRKLDEIPKLSVRNELIVSYRRLAFWALCR